MRADLVKSLRATEMRSTALLSKLSSRASLARDNKLSPRPKRNEMTRYSQEKKFSVPFKAGT